ncbi:TetR/AcrR family transcriptional regulator [Metabacillus endolithicus]|uniref:TetR/AcrR family transcriptional regulator n=1 Tax=Metabacillus endolithicus TaxID=1535204 RepID=A0ABW5C2B6_9BACI|nr:TetR/AcrR family transcriptional regulator [Metabacillus endolithicus]UPG64973.1 TetR/AcrR family transcriptional regulator [Metabacillus endolithicus]
MTRGQDQKDKIVDAAMQIFGKKGFYDTKMLDIAEKAGVSKGTIYLYFSSKDELYIETHERNFQRYIDMIEAKVNTFSSFKEKLICIAEEQLAVFYRDKHTPNKYLQAYNNNPKMIKTLHDFLDNYHQYVTSVMEKENILNASDHAKAFIGMLENYKRDIFFNKDFDYSMLLKTVLFVVDLFLKGCQRNNS